MDCVWNIKSKGNSKVLLRFYDINLSAECPKTDCITVRDGEGGSVLKEVCGGESLSQKEIYSTGNSSQLVFKANCIINAVPNTVRGFKVYYQEGRLIANWVLAKLSFS